MQGMTRLERIIGMVTLWHSLGPIELDAQLKRNCIAEWIQVGASGGECAMRGLRDRFDFVTLNLPVGGEQRQAQRKGNHLKKCSRGKLAHISFRASRMSSSETENSESFKIPKTLSNGGFSCAPSDFTKSKTFSCFSRGNSRIDEATASRREFGPIDTVHARQNRRREFAKYRT